MSCAGRRSSRSRFWARAWRRCWSSPVSPPGGCRRGPITLGFLSPYIADALSPQDGGIRVELADTVLIWGGWDRNLEIRARGVRALRADGSQLARVPEVALGLSIRALTRGMVAPTSLDLIGPSLHISLGPDGGILLGMGDEVTAGGPRGLGGAEGLRAMLTDLLTTPDPNRPLGYLSRVAIEGASLVVDDQPRSRTWRAFLGRIAIERDIAGIRGEALADLDVDGRVVNLALAGLYDAGTGTIDAGLRFQNLDTGLAALAIPQLADVAALETTLGGEVRFQLDDSGRLESAQFEVSAGPATLRVPAHFPDGLPIALVQSRGRIVGPLDRVLIDNLLVDLGGPSAVVTAELDLRGERPRFEADMAVHDMPFDDLGQYWPPTFGRNARRWMLPNLRDGFYREVTATVVGTAADRSFSALEIEAINGALVYEDLSVSYFDGMPPIRNLDGTATFDIDQLDLVIERGGETGLEVAGGEVHVVDIGGPDEHVLIDLQIRGSLGAAIELIDHAPLHYARKLGIAPADLAGHCAIDLSVRVLLIDQAKLAAIDIRAGARLEQTTWRQAAFGLDARAAALTVRLDKESMTVEGDIALGDTALALVWEEYFAADAALDSRVTLVGVLDDAARARVGFAMAPVVTGPVGVRAVLTDSGAGFDRVEADLELTATRLALPGFGWTKDPAVPAKGRIVLGLEDGRLASLEEVSINGGGLVLAGRGRIDADGGLERLDVGRLAFGLNELQGAVQAWPDGSYRLRLAGRSLDARAFLGTAATGSDLPALGIDVELDRVWIGPGRYLSGVKGRLTRDADGRRTIQIESALAEDKALRVTYQPVPEGRALRVFADDAGAALRVFDIADTVIGGTLQLTATEADADPGTPLEGRLFMENYRVIQAPILAQLLTLASLTGFVETLSGDGIAFDQLDVPFSMANGIVTVEKAHGRGSEIGITASGSIDTRADTAMLEGLIVPAYSINSFWGDIPVLGDLLVGEEGGGVFAFTYDIAGPLDDPRVQVNPLAALTPGFLRGIFDIFGSPSDAAAAEEGEDDTEDRDATK